MRISDAQLLEYLVGRIADLVLEGSAKLDDLDKLVRHTIVQLGQSQGMTDSEMAQRIGRCRRWVQKVKNERSVPELALGGEILVALAGKAMSFDEIERALSEKRESAGRDLSANDLLVNLRELEESGHLELEEGRYKRSNLHECIHPKDEAEARRVLSSKFRDAKAIHDEAQEVASEIAEQNGLAFSYSRGAVDRWVLKAPAALASNPQAVKGFFDSLAGHIQSFAESSEANIDNADRDVGDIRIVMFSRFEQSRQTQKRF